MKKTRKIISIIMCIVIALSVFTVALGVTIQNTVFNQKFVSKYFITSDLESECNEQLKLKFKVLEKKSNIPSKVFKKVIDEKPIGRTMDMNVQNFFEGRDTSLKSEDIVDYFYELCIEYLEENNFDYDENEIKNVAVEAAKIYSDSVGISNIDHLKIYIEEQKQYIVKAITYSAILCAVACLLMYSIYSNSKRALKYMAQSVIASGTSGLIMIILSKSFGYGFDLPISPKIYMESINHLVNIGYIVFAAVSLAIIIVGIMLTASIDKQINKERDQKESRFFKRLDNF